MQCTQHKHCILPRILTFCNTLFITINNTYLVDKSSLFLVHDMLSPTQLRIQQKRFTSSQIKKRVYFKTFPVKFQKWKVGYGSMALLLEHDARNKIG